MSNPTTPFSWQMPTATDLVTDLPADFEVFGQAVATSMADLLGGTTGQVLSKTTNADMDFTWIANDQGDITGVTAGTGITGGGTSGTVTVTNDMATTITTAGDLIYGTGSGTYTRRGIGSTSQVLTVAGGVPTWATPATPSSGLTLITTQAFTTAGTVSVNDIFSATYDHYKIILSLTPSAGIALNARLRVSSTDDSSSNYRTQRLTASSSTVSAALTAVSTSFEVTDLTSGTPSIIDVRVYNPFATKKTNAIFESTVGYPPEYWVRSDFFDVTTSFTGMSFITTSGTITGTLSVWGYSK